MLKISINNILDPCKGIQDTPGFWIARHGFRIPLRYWMPVFVSGTRIPDSFSGFVDSKSPGLRIPRAKFPGFQIPQARFPYMVRTTRHRNNVLLWTFYGNSKLTAECLSLSRRKLQLYWISGSSILVQSGPIFVPILDVDFVPQKNCVFII